MATGRLIDTPFPHAMREAAERRSAEGGGILRHRAVITCIWVLADILTVALASWIALAVRIHFYEKLHPSGEEPFITHAAVLTFALCILLFSLLLIFVSRSIGLYGPLTRCSGLSEQYANARAVLGSGLLLAGTLYILRLEAVPRGLVLLTVLNVLVLLSARRLWWRYNIYQRHRRGMEVRNILIVGTGHVSKSLRSHLESVRHLGFNFKGYIQFAPNDRDAPSDQIIGGVHELIAVCKSQFIDEIFVSTPCERGIVKKIVSDAMEAGIDVRVIPDLYDGLAWGAPVEYLGQFPTIPLHRRELPVAEQFAKRMLDVAVSAVGLLVLSPFLLMIGLLVTLDSPGPMFYTAERIGKKGRRFGCIKFRTMARDADARKAALEHRNERSGVLFKIKDDPRITRIGRTLRRYSLDELPQLWNVVRGEMSLVGPRPPIASEVGQYELVHLRRLAVSPGITGLWQVEARQDPSFDSYISFDTAYVENWSLFLDFKILIRTIAVVFAGTGS